MPRSILHVDPFGSALSATQLTDSLDFCTESAQRLGKRNCGVRSHERPTTTGKAKSGNTLVYGHIRKLG